MGLARRSAAIVFFACLAILACAVADAREGVIVALGDSLTAGYGVARDEAWPARLGVRLRREGYAYRVVNAGVSGETSAGGLRRVDWVLRARPAVVIVALGANDGLRGLSLPMMRRNLVETVRGLLQSEARVLLVGMRLPPNYGDHYAREFAETFPAVAAETGVPLMPFLLDGVAADPALNQADGLHPSAAGHRIIAERVWPHLLPLLDR